MKVPDVLLAGTLKVEAWRTKSTQQNQAQKADLMKMSNFAVLKMWPMSLIRSRTLAECGEALIRSGSEDFNVSNRFDFHFWVILTIKRSGKKVK
jgi:hypothetical protein